MEAVLVAIDEAKQGAVEIVYVTKDVTSTYLRHFRNRSASGIILSINGYIVLLHIL